ncbi:hypothetical protein HB779_19545 [Phyllobacterium sp. 628]|uniref:hypothetical protein n=1 Tax=Phyllobacterium sp. 628 TaxID=2718938 RepID=UPI0016622E35|nr:hypothetical protein [Phyllobacterium sp. 628]QND53842.1 hypothetical protein HB779_19545 [Phyllobacterium sp. 628]
MPATPDLFHFQRDTQRSKPHGVTSKVNGKADAAVEEANPLRYTAGPVLLLLPSTLPLMLELVLFGNERGVA